MVSLAQAIDGDTDHHVALVLSNRPGVGGLTKAQDAGLSTHVLDHKNYPKDRSGFEADLHEVLETAEIDVICLAGFMRILTPGFVNKWAGKILNIHPSLLPKYPGLNTHQRAIDAGDLQHGCTVHLVTGELDAGPILGQASVDVAPDDTAATLATRVLQQEHVLYPLTLRRYLMGQLSRIDL